MTKIEFFQQLINGLSLGSFYALIALGYTMVYGVLRFINFAHGDVFMLGAFSGYYLTPRVLPHFSAAFAPIGVAVVLLSTMCICAVVGMTIERLAYRPLRKRPKLTVLITAIGVSLFLEYGGQFVFGADPKAFPELVVDRTGLDREGTTILDVTLPKITVPLNPGKNITVTYSAAPTWTLREAVAAMQSADVDRLPVIDGDGRFIGVVSTSEILKLDEILDAQSYSQGG